MSGFQYNAPQVPGPTTTGAGRFLASTGVIPGLVLLGDSLTAALAEAEPFPTLASAGGALVNQALPGPGALGEPNDTPMIPGLYQLPNAIGAYHQFADTTIADEDASRSWSVDICFRRTTNDFPVNAGQIVGKRQASGDLIGWELTMGADGSVTATLNGSDLVQHDLGFSLYNNAAGQKQYSDGQWHNFCLQFDVAAMEFRAGVEHAPTMTEAWSGASPSTATPFRIGGVRLYAVGPLHVGYVVFSYGAQSVADDPSARALRLALDASLVQRVDHRNEPTS